MLDHFHVALRDVCDTHRGHDRAAPRRVVAGMRPVIKTAQHQDDRDAADGITARRMATRLRLMRRYVAIVRWRRNLHIHAIFPKPNCASGASLGQFVS